MGSGLIVAPGPGPAPVTSLPASAITGLTSLSLSDTIPLTPFTPTFTFGTSVGDLSVTYTSQVGQYMKLGRLLFFTAQVNCTPTFTSATGAATMTLPGFPPALAGSFPAMISGRINGTGVTWAAGQTPVATMGTVAVPTAFFVFMTSGAAIGTLIQSNVASGVALQIVMTGFYVTAS